MSRATGRRRQFTVGRAVYDTLITKDKLPAENWVKKLPLLDPSPPVPRIFGFSCSWGVEGDGTPVVHSIHLSFFSCALVLYVAGWGLDDGFPPVLADLLSNPRNLFVGDEVNMASETLGRSYGVQMPWRMDLGVLAGMRHAGEVPPHVMLARIWLGWPEERLITWDWEGPWTWPLSELKDRFALQSCVLPQLLGHHMALQPPVSVPSDPEWW